MNEQQTVTATADAPPSDASPTTVTAPVPAPDATPAQAPAVAQAQAPDAAPVGVGVEPDYRALYENVKRENEILRHNAEVAQSAPVQGVSGGGIVTAPVDDFIRGFDSDEW